MNKNDLASVDIDMPFAERLGKVGSISGGEYEVGTYQPAVVALDTNFQLLFSWSSVPTASNVGGAIGRPHPDEVWESVRASLGGDMSLVHRVPPSTYGAAAKLPLPLPLFYALLLANGNFLGPGPFTFDENGRGDTKGMMQSAMIKLGGAVIVNTSLLVMRRSRVPTAVALVSWLAYLRATYGDVSSSMWGVSDKVVLAPAPELKAKL